MNKLVARVVIFLSILGIVESIPLQEVSASAADFSVQAILPDIQKIKNVSYFDFELSTNELKEIEIEITNIAEEERTYSIEVATATTNINGIIDYTEQKREQDNSLLINFADIVKFDPRITIQKGETVRVPIQIEMPDKKFEGILLGGITVAALIEEDEQNEQIMNHFSYSIGIVLSQGDVTPPLELSLLGVSKGQINKRNIISGTIQNTAAKIVDDLSIDARIYREGQEKPLFNRTENRMRMAPNSNFDFGVGTNNRPLKAGKYTMTIMAKAEDQKWEWSEAFEITAKEAREFNSTAIELEKDNTIWYLWVTVGLLLIVIVIVMLFIKRKKKV